jgi:2-(3-amino-3-carboxypropyl)histidine synthase
MSAMKILHIPAISKIKIELSKEQIAKLPKKLGIVTTIQHLQEIESLAKKIGAINAGQILGCDVSRAEKIKDKVDAYLYVGTGEFHPLGVARATKKDVYIFNPFSKAISKISNEDIIKYEKKRKAALVKFLSAKRVGILVSTKKGQSNMKKALELSKKKDKEYFIFAFDTLIEPELENFPFIECWVNTACPRIADGKANIINIDEIPKP